MTRKIDSKLQAEMITTLRRLPKVLQKVVIFVKPLDSLVAYLLGVPMATDMLLSFAAEEISPVGSWARRTDGAFVERQSTVLTFQRFDNG